jgi:hypothetical protein
MKRKTVLLCTAVLAGCALATTPLLAQHFAVDEYGNMTINGARGPQGVVAVEPISGLATLRYPLPGYPGILGDVVMFEPPNFTQISDIVRFPGNGFMYFFSAVDAVEPPEPGVLADGVLPAELPNPNHVEILENGPEGANGLLMWSPQNAGAGGAPSLPTYDFISDGVVPEPSSIVLGALGAGSLLLLALRRRS